MQQASFPCKKAEKGDGLVRVAAPPNHCEHRKRRQPLSRFRGDQAQERDDGVYSSSVGLSAEWNAFRSDEAKK